MLLEWVRLRAAWLEDPWSVITMLFDTMTSKQPTTELERKIY
jgi:hypothetical protein